MTDYSRREFGRTLAAGAATIAVPQPSPRATLSTPGSLTDVPGVRVGHYTDTRRPTGCSVILFDPAAAAGADYAGSAPGESLGVLLQPISPVERIHGIFVTGGGPLALPAAGGVLRFLQERKIGFDWGPKDLRVPIVVSGAIDDLMLGDATIRPDGEAAYKACSAALAESASGPAEGNVGAGAGATIGKMHRSRGFGGMKGGVGTASLKLGDVVVGALAFVNAAGDVLDWRIGRIVAGARRPDGSFADSVQVMHDAVSRKPGAGALDDPVLGSTTIAVVATNVSLTKTALTKLAIMANCGAARAVRPYHTNGDGDQLLAVSTDRIQRPDLSLTVVGALAADVVADAIVRAVRAAASVEGWPGLAMR